MKLMSPEQFEIAYRKKENSFYGWMALHVSWPLMAVGCAILYFLSNFTDQYFASAKIHYFFVGAFVFFRMFRRAFWVVLLFGLVAPYVPRRWQEWFQFGVVITVAMMSESLFYKGTTLSTMHLGLLPVPLVLIASWVYLRAVARGESKWEATIVYSLFFWFLTAGVSFWLWHGSFERQLSRFWQFKLQFVWVSMLVLVWQGQVTKKETMFAFNPMNGFRGVLWPYDFTWEEDTFRRRRIWWNGFFNIALGYSVLLFRIWLERGPLIDFRYSDPSRVSGHIFTILADVGSLNLVSGITRLFGYRMRDATNFVFLARTPADVWRRSSTYNYLFVLRCVYMPLFRIWRSFLFASFLAFLVFFINHHGLQNFLKILLHLTHIRTIHSNSELFQLTGFSLHFLFVFLLLYFTRRSWFFSWRKMNDARVAWASIALTHALRVLARMLSWLLARMLF